MSALEASLRALEARAAADEQAARAAALEARHDAAAAALQRVRAAGHGHMLLCTGAEAFVRLPTPDLDAVLQRESAKRWDAVDRAQRSLHVLTNRAADAAQLADIAREVERDREAEAEALAESR